MENLKSQLSTSKICKFCVFLIWISLHKNFDAFHFCSGTEGWCMLVTLPICFSRKLQVCLPSPYLWFLQFQFFGLKFVGMSQLLWERVPQQFVFMKFDVPFIFIFCRSKIVELLKNNRQEQFVSDTLHLSC